MEAYEHPHIQRVRKMQRDFHKHLDIILHGKDKYIDELNDDIFYLKVEIAQLKSRIEEKEQEIIRVNKKYAN